MKLVGDSLKVKSPKLMVLVHLTSLSAKHPSKATLQMSNEKIFTK